MPLIKHTEEFLEKQKRRQIAIEALAKKQEQEIAIDRRINLIMQETQLREELNALDPTNLEDHLKFYELQSSAMQNGIPLVKFFSKYQYEVILKMIRALRLYQDIAKEVFNAFEPDIFRETEEIIAICKSNIEHLKVLEEFGEIAYKQQYSRAKKTKKPTFKFQDLETEETPSEFQNKLQEFMTQFHQSTTNENRTEQSEEE